MVSVSTYSRMSKGGRNKIVQLIAFVGVIATSAILVSRSAAPRAGSLDGAPATGGASHSFENDNDDGLPNSVNYGKIAAHVEALNDAMKPGRGYQPTPKRYNSMLPEAKGSFWWLNNCGRDSVPEAFGIAALDMTYPKDYFFGRGHPSETGTSTDIYFKYIARYAGLCLGRNVTSLVEFGNGGGIFAKSWSKMYGKDFVTVEGSGAGCKLTLERGVPKDQVVQHDLRHPIFLGRKFDVAVCTEVVEHVEPVFASQIVLNLVMHSDIIWFSFKQVGLQNGAWINHPNERPFELWKNLFDFYGYHVVRFDSRLVRASYYRGDFIAYKRDNSSMKPIDEQSLVSNLDEDVLNFGK